MLDFDARVELLRQKFSHTGFGPEDEIIEYIAGEITQNVRTLKAAARAVVACLLATPGRSEIDLPTVKKLLKSMHLYDVPGLKGEKPVPVKEGDSCLAREEADAPEKEPEAEVEASPFIVVDIEDENENAPEPPKAEDDTPAEQPDADPGQYRTLVASASTVEKQIDALLQAAEKRIEQLRKKNAGPGEIAKLEKAVEHLRNKDLEAAMTALK